MLANSQAVPAPASRARRYAHELIESRALLNPGRTAVVSEGREITYGELDRRAAALAGDLAERGLGPEMAVAILLPRDVELIVAILAVLKAGAAFIPLEPSWPEARLTELLKQAAPKCILTTDEFRDRFDLCSSIVVGDQNGRRAGLRTARPAPANLAYLLFTSGSTGKPKAVAVEHRNLSNYIYSITALLGAAEGTSFALLNSAAADLGYTALFPSLCAGSTLHLIPPEVVASPEALAERFDRYAPDIVKITPSLAAALVSSRQARRLLPRKCLVLGGEALHKDLVQRIRELAPGLRVLNHYGPTETTVGVVVNPDANDSAGAATVPIGRPLPGAQIHILDGDLNPVPESVSGEIYIAGPGVSRGYLGDPARTAERFVPDPSGAAPGGRLYRTGDTGRRLANGDIEFLSRIDQQIKIRGYRVEPGEIESILCGGGQVSRVAVQLQGVGEQACLVAYVEPRPAQACDPAALQQWLRGRVPEYMVPARFLMVPEMPCLPSGKIDRQALSGFGAPASPPKAEPAGPLEMRVARVWRQVLGSENIGKSENFFDAGGNSLSLIRLQVELEKEFGRAIPIAQLFAHPTIFGMAADLASGPATPAGAGARKADARASAISAVRRRRAQPILTQD